MGSYDELGAKPNETNFSNQNLLGSSDVLWAGLSNNNYKKPK